MIPAAILLMTALTVEPSNSRNTPRSPTVETGFHVRCADAAACELLDLGAAGSRTFSQLLDQLAASDLIVYITTVDRLRGGISGRMSFAATGGSYRFLRIEILLDGNSFDRVAALGHELQHAAEVAAARDVRDNRSLAMLYLHIGWTYGGGTRYESLAARATGERVREEITLRR